MAPRRDNQKAVEVRERRAAQAAARQEAELKAKEDAKWRDDGTKLLRQKEARKAAADQKVEEQRRRREEKAALEQAEAEALKGTLKGSQKTKAKKITQYELIQRQLAAAAKLPPPQLDAVGPMHRVISTQDMELQENLNHRRREEALDALLAGGEIVHASNIDDALEQLEGGASPSAEINNYRKAYKEFEARELETLRAEYPELKRSQLLDRVRKAWQKSLAKQH